MRCHETAEQVSPSDNPDAILRWNTCARFLQQELQFEERRASMMSDVQAGFGDDMPLR